MTYMIVAYGNDVPADKKNIKTLEEAKKVMKRMVKKWCKDNEIDIDDTDYCEGDGYFQYGMEEWGVGIFEIIEVPNFKNKIEKLLWEAKMEMKYTDYAAEMYKWTLEDCCVDYYTNTARKIIDEVLELMKS